MERLMKATALLASVLSLLGLMAASALGLEEEPSPRQQYVETAEPICKQNVIANKHIFKGAKREVKEGKLKLASTHFFRAAKAFGKTIEQLAAIPRPQEDAGRLSRWLDLLRNERRIIEKIGRALAAGNKQKAESYSVDLNQNSNKANNAVLGFGFDYFRIDRRASDDEPGSFEGSETGLRRVGPAALPRDGWGCLERRRGPSYPL